MVGSTQGNSLLLSGCMKGRPTPELGAVTFLNVSRGCFRPGKSLSGEKIPRQSLGKFVLTSKNRGRKGDSFLSNYLLGILGNIWPLMGPQNGETVLLSMAPIEVESESEVAQSCLTLCDPVDCSHGILQARILEWVTIFFSRGSSQHRDRTRVSHIGDRRFNLWATRVAHWGWKVDSKEGTKCQHKEPKEKFWYHWGLAASGQKSPHGGLLPLECWFRWDIWSIQNAGPKFPCLDIIVRCPLFLGDLVIQRIPCRSFQASAKCPISNIKDRSILFKMFKLPQFSSVQFSHSVMSDSLQPHGQQHTRLPCPSPTPGACSNSCPSSGYTIQPFHPLLSPSPPAFHLSQHQGLF